MAMKQRWQDLAKTRMKEVGMTQEQLAEALGITQGGLGHWLNARREPNLEVIAKIFNILKMPAAARPSARWWAVSCWSISTGGRCS